MHFNIKHKDRGRKILCPFFLKSQHLKAFPKKIKVFFKKRLDK